MKVLFVCKANIGRSQMAQGFYNKFTSSTRGASAGVQVNGSEGKTITDNEFRESAQHVVECMAEEGIDLTQATRHQITPKMVEDADLIIYMSETEMPALLQNSEKVALWEVPNPKNVGMDGHRKVRDQIKYLVENLVDMTG